MRSISFGQATIEAMTAAMREDPAVIIMGEDIGWGGNFGQFKGLLDEFGPERIIDMPISEALILGAAVGAAVTGTRPVASMSFVEFTMGAMDEIVNQAAKFRYMFGGQVSVPLVLRASDGVLRASGPQHSGSLESFFTHVPGLKVVAPSNPADAKGLLRSAIDDDDPVIYLENKKITSRRGQVPEGDYRTPLGQASVVREGRDVSLITYSVMTQHALEAARQLDGDHSVDAEVVDLRSLVPLDLDTLLGSAAKTRRAVVCHEAWKFGGFGAELVAQISNQLFGELEAPVGRVGARSAPTAFSPPLERALVPEAREIVETTLHVLGLGRR